MKKNKSNILTVMKKEFSRFFGDKRLVFTAIILPGLMIYVLYSFMGSAITNMVTVDEDYVPKIYAVNLPDSIAAIAQSGDIEITKETSDKIETRKTEITNKDTDILVVFPENFDALVDEYESMSGGVAPNVEIYYNSVSTKSSSAYMTMNSLLDSYEKMLANKFDVNSGEKDYDLVLKEDATGQMFASMLPMLMMVFLFSGCLSIAPESIAGEKERGTIATLLVTPMKRSELAIGKILSLGTLALLCGLSSFIGTMLSLPKLMGGAGDEFETVAYSAIDYLWLILVIFSTVLVLIAVISVISTYAKTVKEAATSVTPLMIIVMLIGLTSMFSEGAQTQMVYYFIPFYNSVQAMSGIFLFNFEPVNIVITIISNLVYSGIGILALTKMFNSEKVMFSR